MMAVSFQDGEVTGQGPRLASKPARMQGPNSGMFLLLSLVEPAINTYLTSAK
ncbi:hypothetical protein [Niveispirillum sp. BGYR6]|uniref:hypothetical protein n=1 Tax=Niveispirillum sp. BGYR6 TaxID=2971249 RepID=UPI0022B94567|nr:hypothetical protein [Niveispirillum sp. BGYR6]MDG5494870.1 hypothetical protein [Niveispirillum sp. BGYR6]